MKTNTPFVRISFVLYFLFILAYVASHFYTRYERYLNKKIALVQIQEEVENNHQVLQYWNKNDMEIDKKIKEIRQKIDSDSTYSIYISDILIRIRERGISAADYSTSFNEVAWRTTKETGLLSYFDYGVVKKLETIYVLQHELVQKHQRLVKQQQNFVATLPYTRKNEKELRTTLHQFTMLHLNMANTSQNLRYAFEDVLGVKDYRDPIELK